MQPLVILTRTNRIESVHYGHICIADSNKKIVHCIGDEEAKVYLRSSAKPIQALALVNSGAIEKYDISLEELAIICSSHSGEDFHRETVKSILNKIGLSEKDLNCGIANPYNENTVKELLAKDEKPTQLYNCCSGKHAGMLTLCKYYNYPTDGYTEKDHPIQKLILSAVAELLGYDTNEITIGIDGCGVPTYMLYLRDAAYLYSLLAQGASGKTRYNKSFALIQKAMLSYPRMINGDKEFCTDLIDLSEGRAIGKVGAEGIYCVAVPEKQLGICIKVYDGNERGVYPATIHTLRQLGILDDDVIKKLRLWAYPPVKNHKGIIVGYSVPIFDIDKGNHAKHIETGEKFEFKGEELWNH